MKLVTYRSDNGLRAGVLLGDYVVDLQQAAAWSREDVSLPDQIIDLLEAGTSGMQSVNKVLTAIEKDLSSAAAAKGSSAVVRCQFICAGTVPVKNSLVLV